MTPIEQAKIKAPYAQTSLMINELINLDHEVKGTNIKIKEKPGMRKDRFSSIEYLQWCVLELSLKLKPKKDNSADYSSIFKIRAPKKVTRYK